MRFLTITLLALVLSAAPAEAQNNKTEPVYGTNTEPVYGTPPAETKAPPGVGKLILPEPDETFAADKKEEKNKPPVVLYGKMADGWTEKYIEALKEAEMTYTFKDLNDRDNWYELHARTTPRNSIQGFLLPVVEKDGKFTERPDIKELTKKEKKKP